MDNKTYGETRSGNDIFFLFLSLYYLKGDEPVNTLDISLQRWGFFNIILLLFFLGTPNDL